MKAILYIFFSLTNAIISFSQIPDKNDTTLYLFFDKNNNYKIEHSPKYHQIEKKIVDPEDFYCFEGYNLYDGYPLNFYSIDKARDTFLTSTDLARLKVFQIEQVKNFLQKEFAVGNSNFHGTAPYWNKLKHIYLVEKSMDKYKLTEVRLHVDIE